MHNVLITKSPFVERTAVQLLVNGVNAQSTQLSMMGANEYKKTFNLGLLETGGGK